MMKFSIDLPFLFGDHHVLEVKRLINELPGVMDSYVSSSFHIVEVTYDQDVTGPDKIKACLEEAGYLGDAVIPEEIGVASTSESEKLNSPFFRKTDVYATTQNVVSFKQHLSILNRKVWPCPGFGVLLSVKHQK